PPGTTPKSGRTISTTAGRSLDCCNDGLSGSERPGRRDTSSGGSRCDDVHTPALPVEQDDAIGEREERVIAAAADVAAGMVLGAPLADDDAAGMNLLAA